MERYSLVIYGNDPSGKVVLGEYEKPGFIDVGGEFERSILTFLEDNTLLGDGVCFVRSFDCRLELLWGG